MTTPLKGPEGSDLAQWLVEAGRRARLDNEVVPAPPPIAPASAKAPTLPGRRSVLVGVTALAFLQYYYFHVMVEIGKLPTVVVFVPSPLS